MNQESAEKRCPRNVLRLESRRAIETHRDALTAVAARSKIRFRTTGNYKAVCSANVQSTFTLRMLTSVGMARSPLQNHGSGLYPYGNISFVMKMNQFIAFVKQQTQTSTVGFHPRCWMRSQEKLDLLRSQELWQVSESNSGGRSQSILSCCRATLTDQKVLDTIYYEAPATSLATWSPPCCSLPSNLMITRNWFPSEQAGQVATALVLFVWHVCSRTPAKRLTEFWSLSIRREVLGGQ
ncbi:hypothetical protein DE146DRAFT_636216 [Phaeosphaeria sp. MPI-PUGE-AT-0046c]|nr:hypothetical protein DE146DRAFT_636216 [Phaeosphaeria sp. MPI-PUGE-AT-0046c]